MFTISGTTSSTSDAIFAQNSTTDVTGFSRDTAYPSIPAAGLPDGAVLQTADDFNVPAGGWYITGAQAYGVYFPQENSKILFVHLDLTISLVQISHTGLSIISWRCIIYADNSGKPSAVNVSYFEGTPVSGLLNPNPYFVFPRVYLPQGTYWISIYPVSSLTNTTFYWAFLPLFGTTSIGLYIF
jgi:hypothetical protein